MGQLTSLLLPTITCLSALILALDLTGYLGTAVGENRANSAYWTSVAGLIIGGTLWLRDYARGACYHGKERIPGKTVIITGANTGIGKETARELAKRGGRIILACRDQTRGEAALKELIEDTGNPNIILKNLDLGSLASVRDFAKDINATEPRLDILINNAGIMMCPYQLTTDGFETQLGVNHIGHFLLTNLLLDKLKASAPSRIIILSSIAHTFTSMNFDDIQSKASYRSIRAYGQSKLANVLHTRELAKRLEGTGITVNCLHPGGVSTDLQRHMGPLVHSTLGKIFWAPVRFLLFKTPVQGAQTTLQLALDPSLETVTGKYFSEGKEKTPSRNARSDEDAKRLWALSEEWTKNFSS